MRTRVYDRSVVVNNGGVVTQGGYSAMYWGVSPTNGSYPVQRELKNRVYGFFVDEPHRPRKDRFGYASRWEEEVWPNLSSCRSYNSVYNEAGSGNDHSHSFYDDAQLWINEPNQGLVTHDLDAESVLPWPYRYRSRRDLNNQVQRQRQRMYAYNGGVAETIAELPECPQLFRLINTAKGVRANVTGLSLGYKFGWAPSIDAFQAALSELRAFRQGLATLRRRSGLQTLRYSGPDSWCFTNAMKKVQLQEWNANHYGFANVPRQVYHNGVITWTAVVDMKPLYDDRTWQLMARLGSIGAIPSLRTLWELLPRSFLVDWLVSIGDVISDIQGNLLYHIDIKQQCWSWKIHDRIAMDREERYSYWNLSEKSIKAFYRSEVPPLGSWKVPTFLPGLGSGQKLTLALLLGQCLPWDTPSLRSLLRRINRFGYR